VATCLENTETINCQKILELREIQIFGQDTQNQIQEKAVDAYYEIANKHGLDLAQMSLKFLEIQPFVTSVIIGATTMEQLKTNIESVNINLSDDVIKEINNVQTIYPNPCP
jgi:aryl-alcohol dehydrogenase-like predicted oxidoreductase